MAPRYSLLEIERRWRVNPDLLPDLSRLPRRVITDKYLTHTRLRLRKVESEAEAMAVIPPDFCTEEVSSNPLFEAVHFATELPIHPATSAQSP